MRGEHDTDDSVTAIKDRPATGLTGPDAHDKNRDSDVDGEDGDNLTRRLHAIQQDTYERAGGAR